MTPLSSGHTGGGDVTSGGSRGVLPAVGPLWEFTEWTNAVKWGRRTKWCDLVDLRPSFGPHAHAALGGQRCRNRSTQ